MNHLPDMVVLDFCKWLMEQRHCWYDDLMKYTLNKSNLDEIDEYINRYVEEHPDKHIKAYELKNTFRFSKEQVHYILYYEWETTETCMEPPIRMPSKTCMGSSSEEVPMYIELDFLEWIDHNQRVDLFDFEKMPVETFKTIANEFTQEIGSGKRTRDILVDAFKFTKRNGLIKNIMSLFQSSNQEKSRDITEVVRRYGDKSVEYKCMILQRKVNSKEYQALMEDCWEDLDYLTGGCLDIYYDTNYDRSGFEIADKLNSIPVRIKKRVPVIVLWTSSLKEAQGIDIRQLSNDEIFEVIRRIVKAIEDKQSFNDIVREVNHMADELRDGHKPIEKIGIQIRDSAVFHNDNGVLTGINEATQTIDYHADGKASESNKELLEGFTTAEKIIRSFEKLDNDQKSLVIEALNEARDAVNANSDKKIEASKKKFSNTIKLLGTVGKDLIAALAGVANILKFFGIGPGKEIPIN